jgi:REP element-mobilizing transposase RayT
MSRVRRLLVSDRIFFVTVNLRRSLPFLREEELPLVVEALAESRRRMEFLLCGYVVLPDHGHALIWPRPPLTISRAVESVKWQAASLLNRNVGRGERWGSISFGSASCGTNANWPRGSTTCITTR